MYSGMKRTTFGVATQPSKVFRQKVVTSLEDVKPPTLVNRLEIVEYVKNDEMTEKQKQWKKSKTNAKNSIYIPVSLEEDVSGYTQEQINEDTLARISTTGVIKTLHHFTDENNGGLHVSHFNGLLGHLPRRSTTFKGAPIKLLALSSLHTELEGYFHNSSIAVRFKKEGDVFNSSESHLNYVYEKMLEPLLPQLEWLDDVREQFTAIESGEHQKYENLLKKVAICKKAKKGVADEPILSGINIDRALEKDGLLLRKKDSLRYAHVLPLMEYVYSKDKFDGKELVFDGSITFAAQLLLEVAIAGVSYCKEDHIKDDEKVWMNWLQYNVMGCDDVSFYIDEWRKQSIKEHDDAAEEVYNVVNIVGGSDPTQFCATVLNPYSKPTLPWRLEKDEEEEGEEEKVVVGVKRKRRLGESSTSNKVCKSD